MATPTLETLGTLGSKQTELLFAKIQRAADSPENPLNLLATQALATILEKEDAEQAHTLAADRFRDLLRGEQLLNTTTAAVAAERAAMYHKQSEKFVRAVLAGPEALADCEADDLTAIDSRYKALLESATMLARQTRPRAEAKLRLATIEKHRSEARAYSVLASFSEELAAMESAALLAIEGVEARVQVTGGFTDECHRLAQAAAQQAQHAEQEYIAWRRMSLAAGLAVD